MIWYLLASLSPVAFFAAAGVLGGGWTWISLLWMTLFVALLDRLTDVLLPMREDAARQAHLLTGLLGLVHLALLPFAVWALSGGAALGPGQWIALYIALGLYFGQVANANAHDLIHAGGRWPRRLGVAVYSALLFGHHASAHRLVHHVAVATPEDPNSARPGEGFYRFWPRAWVGSFIAGWRAENRLRARRATRQSLWRHPYATYVGGAGLALALGWAIAGWRGVAVWIALAAYAQMQLLLADYVQHYGLHRAQRDDGTYAPQGPQHSWNASQWYSSAMMLNAPHHSDHHLNPQRTFPALRLEPETMPILPASLPLMAACALVPWLWRRVMDPRLPPSDSDRDAGTETGPDTGVSAGNLAQSAP